MFLQFLITFAVLTISVLLLVGLFLGLIIVGCVVDEKWGTVGSFITTIVITCFFISLFFTLLGGKL